MGGEEVEVVTKTGFLASRFVKEEEDVAEIGCAWSAIGVKSTLRGHRGMRFMLYSPLAVSPGLQLEKMLRWVCTACLIGWWAPLRDS